MLQVIAQVSPTSFGETDLNILSICKSQTEQDQVSERVVSSVGMPQPLQIFNENLFELSENVILGNKVLLGNKVTN